MDISKEDINNLEDKEQNKDLSNIIKKFYYKLSKEIHPDKNNDTKITEYFSLCNESVESNILYKLILIAEKLNLNYEISEDMYKILDKEQEILKENIKKLKDKIIYKWSKEDNESIKKAILFEYIKNNAS